MNDSILSQFAPRSAVSMVRPDAQPDFETVDDFVAFGYARGARERVVMLELRKRDGGLIALGYGWLERIEYDPSGCITLRFAGQTVKLHGRNLNAEVRPNVRLVDGLVRHKVPFIQESSSAAAMAAGQESTVIEQIELE
jgi:hypothetical protein